MIDGSDVVKEDYRTSDGFNKTQLPAAIAGIIGPMARLNG